LAIVIAIPSPNVSLKKNLEPPCSQEDEAAAVAAAAVPAVKAAKTQKLLTQRRKRPTRK